MRFSRDEFDLPYPRHPALCEPEALCVCGDPLNEHAFEVEWRAIGAPPQSVEKIESEILTLRRRDGSSTHVHVSGTSDGRGYRCMGRWADQRCRCEAFEEATPAQADFVQRRRALDLLTMWERRAQLYQNAFDQIYRNCGDDDVLRMRAKQLARRHGLTIPDVPHPS